MDSNTVDTHISTYMPNAEMFTEINDDEIARIVCETITDIKNRVREFLAKEFLINSMTLNAIKNDINRIIKRERKKLFGKIVETKGQEWISKNTDEGKRRQKIIKGIIEDVENHLHRMTAVIKTAKQMAN